MNFKSLALLLTAAVVPQAVVAGPLAYGICQTGCNGLAVACYAGAGFTFGVALPAAPPVLIACNVGLGGCMAACAAGRACTHSLSGCNRECGDENHTGSRLA